MRKMTLEELLDRIYCAGEQELDAICKAMTERFSEVHPEWELLTLSVHGHDRKSHMNALQTCLEFFQNQNQL